MGWPATSTSTACTGPPPAPTRPAPRRPRGVPNEISRVRSAPRLATVEGPDAPISGARPCRQASTSHSPPRRRHPPSRPATSSSSTSPSRWSSPTTSSSARATATARSAPSPKRSSAPAAPKAPDPCAARGNATRAGSSWTSSTSSSTSSSRRSGPTTTSNASGATPPWSPAATRSAAWSPPDFTQFAQPVLRGAHYLAIVRQGG